MWMWMWMHVGKSTKCFEQKQPVAVTKMLLGSLFSIWKNVECELCTVTGYTAINDHKNICAPYTFDNFPFDNDAVCAFVHSPVYELCECVCAYVCWFTNYNIETV